MNIRKAMAVMAVGGVGMLGLGTQEARADFIPSLLSVTPTTGGFTYNYQALLTADEAADPGDFFTLYDINGYVLGSATPISGFILSEQQVGITPPKVLPTDSPAVYNITYTHDTGPTSGPQTFTFSLKSVFGPTIVLSDYSSLATKTIGVGAGGKDQATGPLEVPAGAVPEPGTYAAFLVGGLGILGLMVGARKRSALA